MEMTNDPIEEFLNEVLQSQERMTGVNLTMIDAQKILKLLALVRIYREAKLLLETHAINGAEGQKIKFNRMLDICSDAEQKARAVVTGSVK